VTVLEPDAEEFARAAARSPRLSQLSPTDARQALEDLQSGQVAKPRVDSDWLEIRSADVEVAVRLVRPADSMDAVLPVVLYLHGGGWVLGSARTHDRLVRELAVALPAAIAFVEYDRAPEARYPVALEQSYAVARWIRDHGADASLDASRMAVAGDSAGGNLAAALAIMAKRRADVAFVHQSLYYPVTDAGQDTDSYRQFAEGPHLTADTMAWFWDAYLPDPDARKQITASPLRALPEELAGLPETLLVVDECDVLRDEGEAYASKLTAAGVRCTSVRYNGTIHDFMVLDVLRDTAAAASARALATDVLRRALHTSPRHRAPAMESA
jgi:acetyl esterase